MRARHKPWAVPYLEEHPEIVLTEVPSEDAFFKAHPLFLEIGTGKGDFICQMAKAHEGHYLGIERDSNVTAMAVRKIVEGEIKNIRFICGDIDEYFEDLKDIRFDAIYLNFSDPWPKKRHEKRRLTFAPRIAAIASLLSPEGHIVIKTDNPILYAFTLEQAPLAKLTIVEHTDHYEFDEQKDAQTEYERRFRAEGKPIHRIVLAK